MAGYPVEDIVVPAVIGIIVVPAMAFSLWAAVYALILSAREGGAWECLDKSPLLLYKESKGISRVC